MGKFVLKYNTLIVVFYHYITDKAGIFGKAHIFYLRNLFYFATYFFLLDYLHDSMTMTIIYYITVTVHVCKLKTCAVNISSNINSKVDCQNNLRLK